MIRGSTDALTDALSAAFAAYRVHDRPTPANYSLRLSDDPDRFHLLYRGSCVVVASPDPDRVLTALVRHVDAHSPVERPLVPLQAVALIRKGRAILVPTLIEEDVREVGRRLARDGTHLLDTHTPHLDLESGEIVVRTQLSVDATAIERAAALAPPPRRRDPSVPDGRYPIDRWLMMELWDPPGPYSRATATRRAAMLIRGGPLSAGPDVLDRLADLFVTTAAEGIDPTSRLEALALLRR